MIEIMMIDGRKVFYVNVGYLSPEAAEVVVFEMMTKYGSVAYSAKVNT